jgi:hypothetical protein
MNTLTALSSIEGIELAPFGFVRVTGLTINDHGFKSRKVEPTVKMLGSWATNNAYYIVVTERGEVWLSYGHPVFTDACEEAVRSLCPKGGGSGIFTASAVVATGSEQIPMHQLLHRIHDPSWEQAW